MNIKMHLKLIEININKKIKSILGNIIKNERKMKNIERKKMKELQLGIMLILKRTKKKRMLEIKRGGQVIKI